MGVFMLLAMSRASSHGQIERARRMHEDLFQLDKATSGVCLLAMSHDDTRSQIKQKLFCVR